MRTCTFILPIHNDTKKFITLHVLLTLNLASSISLTHVFRRAVMNRDSGFDLLSLSNSARHSVLPPLRVESSRLASVQSKCQWLDLHSVTALGLKLKHRSLASVVDN